MPRLVKGGKWVFGWSAVGPGGEVRIPPDAYREYGFQPGDPLVFLRGSRSSGGCGVARLARLARSPIPMTRRSFDAGVMRAGGRVALPASMGLRSGDRLLAVRGSGLALGFIQRGPIYEKATAHSDLETFSA